MADFKDYSMDELTRVLNINNDTIQNCKDDPRFTEKYENAVRFTEAAMDEMRRRGHVFDIDKQNG